MWTGQGFGLKENVGVKIDKINDNFTKVPVAGSFSTK